jgi:hypothetical protein
MGAGGRRQSPQPAKVVELVVRNRYTQEGEISCYLGDLLAKNKAPYL